MTAYNKKRKGNFENKDIILLDTPVKLEYDKADFNSMNEDTMSPDSRIKYENDRRKNKPEYDTERALSHEYDRRNASHKLLFKLDTRIKSKYDIERVLKQEYDTERALKPEYDNLSSSSCHSRAQTRESSRKMIHCFSGYSGGSTNMIKGDNTLSTIPQSGRSMVEMLGTLAVMGVLSIGGIMGYSYAVDKYRANATINDINLRRIVLLQQANKDTPLNLNEFDTKSTAGYTFQEPELYDDSVALTVGSLPTQVCEMVLDALFNQTVQIDVNGSVVEEAAKCGDDNEITFYFPINSVGSGDRGQNGCSLSSPIYNAETDSCEECPAETPVWDISLGQCTGCETNDDCADGRLCFPASKKCWSYSEHPIDETNGWVHVKVNNHPNTQFHENAEFICNHLGMQLPTPKDFIPDWDGKTLAEPNQDFPFTMSEIAEIITGPIVSMGTHSWVWTNEDRGVGVGAYWGYKIIFARYGTRKGGLWNTYKTNDGQTVCKPL
ncbi:MAG: hypothetical protein IKY98_02545 [Alphaproteobacteria bacterium]|nr:hypothetical protein [Alphaproteobacteria bacterium]